MFGSVNRTGPPGVNEGPLDLVAVVQGARSQMTVRHKSHVWGLWLNTKSVVFEQSPRYYAVASTRPLEAIASAAVLTENGIGFEHVPISTALGEAAGIRPQLLNEFRDAAIGLGVRAKQYIREDGGIRFVGTSLFRSQIDLPASIPVGQLDVSVFLFRGGQVMTRTDSRVTLAREGFEQLIYQFANNHALLYGIFTVALAMGVGLLSSFIVSMRRQ